MPWFVKGRVVEAMAWDVMGEVVDAATWLIGDGPVKLTQWIMKKVRDRIDVVVAWVIGCRSDAVDGERLMATRESMRE